MDKPRWTDDDQFPGAMSFFGASLLREARQKASSLPAATEGQHPDEPLAQAASDGLDEVRRVLGELPEYKHVEALQLTIHRMIMEHLRLSTTTPRGWQKN